MRNMFLRAAVQLRPHAARTLSNTGIASSSCTVQVPQPSGSSSRIKTGLLALADPNHALGTANYFKSKYSRKGDVFIGVRVPQARAVVKAHIHETSRAEVIELLYDMRHEFRKTGGMCLVESFKTPLKSARWLQSNNQGDSEVVITSSESARQLKQRVVEFYLEHLACFDNWDLVDITCYKTLGAWMAENHLDMVDRFCEQLSAESAVDSQEPIDVKVEKAQLASAIKTLPEWYQTLLNSTDFWETRVSIVLLLGVRRERVDFAIHLCKWHLLRLLDEEYEQRIKGEPFADYDLVHKACGWVLRECGRDDRAKLLVFLERYAALMPRTTLQYATEHLDRKLAKSLSSRGKPSAKKQRKTARSAEVQGALVA